MIDPRKIDLHIHTTFSDGTDTPAELLKRVKDLGLSLFSVTDHDTHDGCTVMQTLLREGDPAFVCGVEFSCEDEEGKYHILGYGYDPDSPAVRELVRDRHDYRLNKVENRLDFLQEKFGFTFTAEEHDFLIALPNPGKPHLAKLMLEHGYAATKDEAFRRYLNLYKGADPHITPERAISAILAAGGIPILAHPSYGSGDELIIGKEMEDRLVRLLSFGLRGLEAFYSGFSDTLQRALLTLADKYDLYVTAGSDYHGSNKLVALGDTNLGQADLLPKGLLSFIHDVTEDRSSHQ